MKKIYEIKPLEPNLKSKSQQTENDLAFEHSVRKSVLKQQKICMILLDQIMETQSRYIAMQMHFETTEDEARKFER